MGIRYKKQCDGDVIIPKMRRDGGYRMACCDCGLVHNLDFDVLKVVRRTSGGRFTGEIVKSKKLVVRFVATRNNRATAAKRRKR